ELWAPTRHSISPETIVQTCTKVEAAVSLDLDSVVKPQDLFFSSLKLPTGPCHLPEVGETIQPT
ncbi:MAG: hypothetical protein ACI957_002258, partial [Verrucomicrobiales bacterium]